VLTHSRVALIALLHVSLTTAVIGVGAHPVVAQQSAATCSRVWLGHEADFEQAMRTGTVARMESVPVGVTKPQRARLDPSTPVASFTWKPLKPGYQKGFIESYRAEIAAYQLDRMLELQMVPPVVERTIDGQKGAALYWIENTTGWNVKNPPKGPEPAWSRQLTRMKMFDLLVANIDRNQGNLIYDADWHLFLIDHSRAFTGKKNLKGIAPLAYVDRGLWTRMQALTFESLKTGLGQWVSDDDLRALLTRREAMAKEIGKMVARRGEGSVFVN
jgi:hypothetical protein